MKAKESTSIALISATDSLLFVAWLRSQHPACHPPARRRVWTLEWEFI